MRAKSRLVVLLLCASASAGCWSSRETQKAQADESKRLASLQTDVDSLKTDLRLLRSQVFKLQSQVSRYRSVALEPTEKGYHRIDTTSGFFLLAVKDVERYLDGYRLVLAIGNPTAARYEGFKLILAWEKNFPEPRQGEPDDQFHKRMDEWSSSQKEKEYSFTETLEPASWNTVKVVVAPATAEEVNNIEVTAMETDVVSLAKK